MDWYESQELKEYYRRNEKLSRADLVSGGLSLAFLAGVLATGLAGDQDPAATVVRSVVALSFAVGAAACLVGAITWGKSVERTDTRARAVKAAALNRKAKIDTFNTRSRAA